MKLTMAKTPTKAPSIAMKHVRRLANELAMVYGFVVVVSGLMSVMADDD